MHSAPFLPCKIFLPSHSLQGVKRVIPNFGCNIRIALGNFLKMLNPGPVPRPMDSKSLGEGPGNQYFQNLRWFGYFARAGGVSVGLCLFYRPLLNLPAVLLNSTAFILLFSLYHLYIYLTPEYSLTDYASICSHFLLSFHLLPSSSATSPSGHGNPWAWDPIALLPTQFWLLFWFGVTPYTTGSTILPQSPTEVPCLLHPLAFLIVPPSDHLHFAFL